MQLEMLLESVGAGLGVSRVEAEQAVRATLLVLGNALPRAHRDAVAWDWRPDVGPMLGASDDEHAADAASFARLVGEASGLGRGRAREAAVVTCAALAQWSDGATLERLRGALPTGMAELLRPIERSPSLGGRDHAAPRRPSRSTLAEGSPGSHNPLSAAAGTTQSRSVVAPAAEDYRLSSAKELPATSERRTLATGRPRSARPVNESR